jgi:hypothetical protein
MTILTTCLPKYLYVDISQPDDGQKGPFLTIYPPHHVNVVFERPLSENLLETLYTTVKKQFATLDSTDSSLIGSGSKYVTGRRGFFRKIIRRIRWSSVFPSRS